jgi:putative ABC transport system permease protein
MGALLQDLRYSVRTLLKKPGFALVMILALGLGIGANSAIFSVVSTVLLQPPPYPESERLVFVWENSQRIGRFSMSVPNYVDFRDQNEVFEEISAMATGTYNLTGDGEPERLRGLRVTEDLFRLLRVQPVLGRGFIPDEDRPGAERVVVLTDALWQRRFGGDPAIVGRTVNLSDRAHTVIGVMPPDFRFIMGAELFVPLAADPAEESRGAHYLLSVARLRPGVTPEQAEAALDAIAGRLEQQYPDSNTGWDTIVTPYQLQLVERVRPALLVLLGAVGFVLLIACANVANLLLARAATREKEIAIRTALGAGRGRLVRQLLTESVLLGLLGGALGLLLAYWSLDLMLALKPENLPRADSIGIDGQVMGFTLFLSVATGLLFGLVPALQSTSPHLAETLKEGGGKSTESARRHRLRGLLVVSEVALAVMLLIGAGLLIKSFARLLEVPVGFEPGGVLTARVTLPEAKYTDGAARAAFYRDAQQRIAALPGAESVGLVDNAPIDGGGSVLSFSIDGRPPAVRGEEPAANIHVIGDGYLRTMGIPVVRGRDLTEAEAWGDVPVTLINQTMAQKLWPGQDALGGRIRFGSSQEAPWLTIVGIAGDVRHRGLDEEAGMEVYLPVQRWASAAVTMTFVVRAAVTPSTLLAPLREQIRALDPTLPVFGVNTMEQIVADSVSGQRFNLMLLGCFAALALALAVVGIYGVMAYSITERTREVGIRMALGARGTDVLGMLLSQGMRQVLLGLGLGLAGALAISRVMASLLYGVSATDASVFGGAVVVLAAVALLAVWLPARRATKIDPMVALRYE